MKATVSEKGQVTIPKQLRDRLGIRSGEVLEFTEERGRLVAVKAPQTHDPIGSVYGVLGTGRQTDEVMEELRGPVDAA